MPGKCTFRENWLTVNDELAKWLRPVENNKFKAYCLFCKKQFDISHSGMFAVKSHEEGKKHKDLFLSVGLGKQKTLGFSKTEEKNTSSKAQATEQLSSHCASPHLSSLQNFMIGDDVVKAEILWALNKVMTHSSDRSCSKTTNIFTLMFPDSEIAKKFQMHKDKLGYIITYGLGPFFQNELVSEIKQCDVFCVSFDESLNKIAQRGQMDLIIRFWNITKKTVDTRYLTSAFLGKSTAVDLLNAFTGIFEKFQLPLQKILQISVDGPSVNLKFLKDFQYVMKQNYENQEILETGTCSLHVIHNCFKYAHEKSMWQIHNFLRALYYLFKDFPSRRAEFSAITKSTLFPLKICTIRWIENCSVIERALKMIPFLKLYVNEIKSNPPASNNFLKVKDFLEDNLLVAKLSFMQSVASELEHFLTVFQSDRPLFPFLYPEIFRLAKNICARFLKKDIVNEITRASDFKKVEFRKLENHLAVTLIDIGFGAASSCKGVKDNAILAFRRDCKEFLISLIEKFINAKSPLMNKTVRGASCFAPTIMLNNELSASRITLLLSEFIQKNLIAPIEADSIKKKYLEYCQDLSLRRKFEQFNWKSDRLDLFLTEFLNKEDDVQLFNFSKKILILFHGNAAVERSFSINKECLVENLGEHSLIGQRSVYSAVLSCGGDVKDIIITKRMILEVQKSSSRRKEALKLKQEKDDANKINKNKVVKEIAKLKEQKRKLFEHTEQETRELQKQITEKEKKLKQF